jgi:Domain of unknown function (DUF4351)
MSISPLLQISRQIRLGLLRKLAATPATFELFLKAVMIGEVRSCIAKLIDLHNELTRKAKRDGNPKLAEADLPQLWILTPTLSAEKLGNFVAIKEVESWGEGVYLLPKSFKTGIVVIHQLPETPETLWLRILVRDNVQIRAIAEILGLPADSPYRQNALELFSNLKIVLENKQNKAIEETELMMNLSPLYLEQIDIATQKGKDIGRSEGEKSLMIRMLTRKLGNLDSNSIDQINTLPLESIESLGDALLDFNTADDLTAWLAKSL